MLRAFHGVWKPEVGAQIAGVDPAKLAFHQEYAQRLFHMHLRGGFALALVLDVDGDAHGLLLASASESLFAPVWLARETAWWINPRYRSFSAANLMIDIYEAWARERGCVFAGMAGMGDDPTVSLLYRRRGYAGAETHYLKAL